MLSPQAHPLTPAMTHPPSSKPGVKAWWHHFNFIQKTKKEAFDVAPYRAHDNAEHPVFGKPLKDSLRYASVQISTADANGDLYVWGYIPVVVAKCGLFLKENATEVPGTFRVSGSNKRMRDLQAAFETPPRYGKSLDWKNESYTTHDVASVFRRYLTQMPEPVIPYDMYHLFRDTLAKQPFNQEEVIATYKSLIRRMPRANQYLLLYVLDLLSVFARKSDQNLMTATNLAVIFRPGIIAHPKHEMSPHAHALSQKVLEFLIAQQDWFMLDIVPPPPVGGFPGDDDDFGADEQGGSNAGGGAGGSGAGPSRGGGAPDGGGAGKWREGWSTPTKQGAMDSAWVANAEAGPGTPRTTTRQRVISGSQDVGAWRSQQNRGSGSLSGYGYASQIPPTPPQPLRTNSYPYTQSPTISPTTPRPQHVRRASLQVELVSPKHHMSLTPIGNANLHEKQRRHAHESPGVQLLVSENSGDSGSVFVTPMSSLPPSPKDSSAMARLGGNEHDLRPGHYFAQQPQQQQQPRQAQYPTTTSTRRPTYPERPASPTHAGQGTNTHGPTPIHSRYAHADPQSATLVASPVRSASPVQMPVQFQSSHSPKMAHVQPPTHSYTHPYHMRVDSSPSPGAQPQQQYHTRPISPPLPNLPSDAYLPHGFGLGWAAPLGSGASDVDDVMVVPSEEEVSYVGDDPWKLVPKGYSMGAAGGNGGGGGGFLALGGGKKDKERERAREKEEKARIRATRRRTTMERSELMIDGNISHNSSNISPIQEGSAGGTTSGTVVYGVVRSRTLPSRRKGGDATLDDKENATTGLGDQGEFVNSHSNLNGSAKEKAHRGEKRVLKKQRRVSSTNRP